MTAAQSAPPAPDRKPRDDEIDVYGLTHPGKVRTENQDHFLICALRKQMVGPADQPAGAREPHGGEPAPGAPHDGRRRRRRRRQGCRGQPARARGGEPVRARAACTATMPPAADDREFSEALEAAADQCHAELVARGQENPEYPGMATTLTLYLGVWPRAYLLQVGDSRCYLLASGELLQITRDQTMAQELIDLGVLRRTDAGAAKLRIRCRARSAGDRPHPW